MWEHFVIDRVVAKQLPDASYVVINVILLMIFVVISMRCTFTSTFTSNTFDK